jgi:hypothetical protein
LFNQSKASAKLKLGILLERKNLFLLIFSLLKNVQRFIRQHGIMEYSIILENPERRFSKRIYA